MPLVQKSHTPPSIFIVVTNLQLLVQILFCIFNTLLMMVMIMMMMMTGNDGDTSSGDDGGPPLVVKMRSETGPFQTILHNLVLTKESTIIHSWEII